MDLNIIAGKFIRLANQRTRGLDLGVGVDVVQGAFSTLYRRVGDPGPLRVACTPVATVASSTASQGKRMSMPFARGNSSTNHADS